tara:strand:+ start:195 stop:560 length:366 start_codon:yes stop_codon:yes gene_type:complete
MTSISYQRPPSTKFLEEDYRTIEACKKYILPKIFGDRKFFTAFIRKNTRTNILLSETIILPIWMATKNCYEAGFDRKFAHKRATEKVTELLLHKHSVLWQKALVESEYGGLMPTGKGNPFL